MQFEFMTKAMSAWDAFDLVQANGDIIDYQLAVAASDHRQHEIQLHQDAEPGEPSSPVIESVELSPSHLYVTFRFRGTPVYMTIPAMSTVTLGWLQPQGTDRKVEEIRELLRGDPWHMHHRHNAPPNS